MKGSILGGDKDRLQRRYGGHSACSAFSRTVKKVAAERTDPHECSRVGRCVVGQSLTPQNLRSCAFSKRHGKVAL